MIEQLKIMTTSGRELFVGNDYLPLIVRQDRLMEIPKTGERFRVVNTVKFKRGKNRCVLVSDLGSLPRQSYQYRSIPDNNITQGL